ncbi:MAG TPA: hypothetical protein VJN21_00415 [Candidatus Acidoferrales bacterium]|nr:hypothetical protein [Candidatus Acidoferrales bacterium]
MPDWESKVTERLGGLRLACAKRDEIIAEFAGHLEDVHANFLRQGIDAEEAATRSWSEFPNARGFVRRIERAKQGDEEMNNRVLQFWIPALITSLIGTCLLTFMVEVLRMRPIVLAAAQGVSATIYLPWLLTLPVLGYLGAAISRHQGGTLRASIVSATFLALIYFALPWLILPVAIAVDRHTPGMVPLAWFMLNWAVLPGVALSIGALPAAFFGRERKQQVAA